MTSTATSDFSFGDNLERDRLTTLLATYVLDASLDGALDAFAEMARLITGSSVSLVSLVGETTQYFKAACGTSLTETPLEISFCSHAVDADDVVEVCNAVEDPRFRHNPLVTGAPHVRYYFGVPIHGFTGLPIGTLCVLDDKPRLPLRATERLALEQLARSVESVLERRRSIRIREAQLARIRGEELAAEQRAISNARIEFNQILRALEGEEPDRDAIMRAAERGLLETNIESNTEPASTWQVVIDTVVDSLQGHASDRGIELDSRAARIAPEATPANAARTLFSLIRASIDQSPEGAKVGVRLKSGAHFVCVSIYREDEGLRVVKPGGLRSRPTDNFSEIFASARESLIANGGILEEKGWTGGKVIKAWYPNVPTAG